VATLVVVVEAEADGAVVDAMVLADDDGGTTIDALAIDADDDDETAALPTRGRRTSCSAVGSACRDGIALAEQSLQLVSLGEDRPDREPLGLRGCARHGADLAHARRA